MSCKCFSNNRVYFTVEYYRSQQLLTNHEPLKSWVKSSNISSNTFLWAFANQINSTKSNHWRWFRCHCQSPSWLLSFGVLLQFPGTGPRWTSRPSRQRQCSTPLHSYLSWFSTRYRCWTWRRADLRSFRGARLWLGCTLRSPVETIHIISSGRAITEWHLIPVAEGSSCRHGWCRAKGRTPSWRSESRLLSSGLS